MRPHLLRAPQDQSEHRSSPVRTSASRKLAIKSGSSASWTTTWGSSITRQVGLEPPRTPSPQKCYLCVRNGPMGFGRPCRDRTCDQRIKSPPTKPPSAADRNTLQQSESTAPRSIPVVNCCGRSWLFATERSRFGPRGARPDAGSASLGHTMSRGRDPHLLPRRCPVLGPGPTPGVRRSSCSRWRLASRTA